MGLPSEHSNNTAFEHHFLIAYFCLHNQSSNKKNEPIGMGDRGDRPSISKIWKRRIKNLGNPKYFSGRV